MAHNNVSIPFKLWTKESDITFGPFFPPDRFRFKKSRQLSKEDRLCEGQDVNDTGSENRTIRVSGILRGSEEVRKFDKLLDSGEKMELHTLGQAWEGEVLVDDGDYDGPVGRDQQDSDMLHWKYTLKMVSTGRDEYEHFSGNGILDDGE